MSRTKAALILDPDRREEQLAYLSERVETLHEAGDQLWVSMTEDQAERLAGQGIAVQLHEEPDLIELPAARFDPAAGSPVPPEGLRAASPPEGTSSYHLVQFIAPPDPTWVHEVIRMGGTYIQTLPVNAGIFELTVLGLCDDRRRAFHVRPYLFGGDVVEHAQPDIPAVAGWNAAGIDGEVPQ